MLELEVNVATNSKLTLGTWNGTSYTVGSTGAGLYLITACIPISGTGPGGVGLLVNGSIVQYGTSPAINSLVPGFANNSTVSTVVSLAASDVVKIQFYTSTGSFSGSTITNGTGRITITKLK